MLLAELYRATPTVRAGGGANLSGIPVKLVFEAADGWISLTLLFGTSIGPFTARLMAWIHEEGECDEATRDKDWIDFGLRLHDGTETVEEWERVIDVVSAFVAKRTKQDLMDAALERQLLIAPFLTTGEVVESEQFAAREFWEDIEHPDLGETVRYPGAISRFSATPTAPLGPPPRLGEHTRRGSRGAGPHTGGRTIG